MNLQLDGKKTLVTGSTAGIGFAIARTLAREGASVVITGRTQQRVDNATESIRKEIRDAKISGIAVDLATPEGFQNVSRLCRPSMFLSITWAYTSRSPSSRSPMMIGTQLSR